MHILDLPSVILIDIFELLSYDEVSKKRLVCRRFDSIAQDVLNCGFHKVIKQHSLCFKRIKALLPRRESERRNHCLARHADILTSVETRLSMLSMTYVKYMETGFCCFIPGRVLDEVFRILHLIAKTNKPLKPHEVLQELRDISSMAIEHFDERIATNLNKFRNSFKNISNGLSISFGGLGSSAPTTFSRAELSFCSGSSYALDPLSKRIGAFEKRLRGNSPKATANENKSPEPSAPSTSKEASVRQLTVTHCPQARAVFSNFKKLETEYKKSFAKMQRMEQVQNLQNKRLTQALGSIAELSVQIVELKKRLEDVDAKNRQVSANIKHINSGDPNITDDIDNNTTIKVENNDVEDGTLLVCPSTSGVADKPLGKILNKRRIDAEIQPPSGEEDDIKKSEDNCELQRKKPKKQP